MHLKTVFSLIVPALACLGRVEGAPSGEYTSYEDFNGTTHDFNHRALTARQDARPALRIMPLGASIVTGVGSSNGDGFRGPLRKQLRFKGWLVNMVGSKQNGVMVDRNFEATSGFTIDQARDAARNSYGYKPNVVLINAGTNDANQGLVSGAGNRLEALLGDLWAADGMSKTFVVVSSVLRRNDAGAERNRLQINSQYITMIARLRASGKPIDYIDIDIPLNELTDGIHPNDVGHKKMAQAFWYAIEWGYKDGYIVDAAPMTVSVGNTCDKIAGGAQYGGVTQKGSGEDDGIYYHNSQEMGSIWSYTSEFDRDQWFFAKLYGSKYDDLVGWWYADGLLTFATWKNNGGGKFAKVSDLRTSLFCNPRGIWWVDLNADGYDDFLCVSPNGDTLASINNRDGTASSPPTFKSIGVIKNNVGFLQDRVRWGDIDGDGRADYMIVDDGGNVQAWRNSGTSDIPSWQGLGVRFTSKNMGDQRGVRFEDINGDGRDDWLWVSQTGATTTWTNSRSCKKGALGDGLNVAWRQAFWNGASSGPTHAGPGAPSRDRIHFARIYGEASFGLLPKADYVYLQVTNQTDGRFKFDMKVWKNTGGGSTKLRADGNKYCNMHGHSDGRQDYVWTLSTGKMTVWPNLGKKSSSGDNDPFWGVPKDLWSPGRDLDRRDLHLVDWNNDGACDIAWVDPNNDNRVSVWLNNYQTTGAFSWTYLANPAPVLNCAEKRGVGIHDLPVRFSDVSNNGLSDYICIERDGRFSGWTHNSDGSWERIAQFKKAEGIDRANLRFGNVNGGGGQDMIWVDKYTGDATVYINRGKMDTGGSNWWFLNGGKQYSGSWAGTCQYFPDFDGDGRADLHSIMDVFTNRGETFFNRCALSDLNGDDAGWAPGQDPGFGVIIDRLPIKVPVPSDEPWKTVQCTDPAITSAANDPKVRWEAVKGTSALEDAFADWTGNPGNGGLTFPMQVSDFFNGPESMRCETINVKNGCGDFLQCDDTNYPAGYLILNSFVAISNIYNNFYFAIDKAHGLVGATIGSVQSTFANVKDEEKALRILLDVVGIAFGLFAASSWASFKQMPFFSTRPVEFDNLKDGLNSLVQGGVTIIKDTQVKDKTLKVQNTLEQNVAAMAALWYDSATAVLAQLFDGSDGSRSLLTNLIDGGKLQQNGFTPPTSDELSTSVIRAMYTFLIPMSWGLGSASHHPFILDTGVDCATAAGWGEKEHAAIFIERATAAKTGFCLRDRVYYLVSAKGVAECDDQDVQCFNTKFSMLPGTDSLDGDKWGKITRGDIIEGSINSWVFNGNKNGLKQSDEALVAGDNLNTMVDIDIRAPGVFVIPVCSAEEAAFNWYSASDGSPNPVAHYPCN